MIDGCRDILSLGRGHPIIDEQVLQVKRQNRCKRKCADEIYTIMVTKLLSVLTPHAIVRKSLARFCGEDEEHGLWIWNLLFRIGKCH